jgi:hypothetical protein
MSEPRDDELDKARRLVERNPTDLLGRFALGALLCARQEFREAIPELQKARMNPNCRRRAMQLLVEAYAGVGSHDLASEQRRFLPAEGDDPPEDGEPPTAPMPVPLRPKTPVSSADAKQLPKEPDDNA